MKLDKKYFGRMAIEVGKLMEIDRNGNACFTEKKMVVILKQIAADAREEQQKKCRTQVCLW